MHFVRNINFAVLGMLKDLAFKLPLSSVFSCLHAFSTQSFTGLLALIDSPGSMLLCLANTHVQSFVPQPMHTPISAFIISPTALVAFFSQTLSCVLNYNGKSREQVSFVSLHLGTQEYP